MTTIDPTAEAAREAARGASGKFGEQQHSDPETELRPERSHDLVLSDLGDVYNRDAYALEVKAKEVRMEAFIADARAAVPTAVSAQFTWDYPEDSSARLVFDYYLDEDGNAVEAEDGGFPDITDFHFDETRQARQFGFEESEEVDGATVVFDDFPDRTEGKARAELAVANKLRDLPRERDLRSLVLAAMSNAHAVAPDRIENLSDHDLEQVQAILEDAIRSTANYLRHS